MKTNKTSEVTSPKLGVTDEMIKVAAEELGVEFPEQLKEIWKVSNGLELPGGWRFQPVFDKSNPRKTSNHTGNQLVLQKSNSALLIPDVYIWNHETNKIKK